MRTTKTVIIATIITCAIIISCACAMPASAEDYGEFYPLLTVVTDTWQEGQEYIVECTDKTGNQWCFFSEDDSWQPGDIANLLIWNIGGTIYENEIIEVYWEGYTENISQFYQTLTW